MAPTGLVNGVERVLITGASGFIGRALCQQLKSHEVWVRALGRRSVPGPWDAFSVCDLDGEPLDPDFLTGIDTIFHLAGRVHALAESEEEQHAYQRVNVEGTQRLLMLAERCHVRRFVFMSSVKAMGEGGACCVDETWEAPPETPYGISKSDAEKLVLDTGKRSAIHVCVLRLPLVYGPGAKGNLQRMLGAIARGHFPPLPQTGNRRSLISLDDVARAARLVATDPAANGQIYILTDGAPYSSYEIYALMRVALGLGRPRWSMPDVAFKIMAWMGDAVTRMRGRRFAFDSDAYRKLLGSACYDSRKIRRELGFAPTRRLEDCIDEMVREFRDSRREAA